MPLDDDLPVITPQFGSGGANLVPGGSGGKPTLAEVLIAYRAALLTLEDSLPEGSMALLASTLINEGASLVGIDDVGNYFTGETVEAALQEVGKTKVRFFDATILFSALGAGATDYISITGFPTNIMFLGAVAKASPEFTGEPDLTFQVGFEGGDVNAIIETTALHETGVGTPIAIVQGVAKGGIFYADAEDDGLAVLFTATELNDVSAGSLTVRFYYMPAFP